MRHSVTVSATAVVLAVLMGGCGDAEPAEAGPSSSSRPTASPTPTDASAPTPAVQPRGAHGVTYSVVNWDQHADAPAVAAWKRTLEGVGGSVNGDQVLRAVTEGAVGEPRRLMVSQVRFAWRNDLHVKPVAKIRVESVTGEGDRRQLAICQWTPSTAFYQRNGTMYGAAENTWDRVRSTMVKRDGHWVISRLSVDGHCQGGAPR